MTSAASPPPVRRRKTRWRRRGEAMLRRLRRWRRTALRARRRLARSPRAVRVAVVVATVLGGLLIVLPMANIVYQVARKPAEMFSPLSGVLNKQPAETWRQYGPLFQVHATAAVSAEVLAALAQSESAGNPVARTYWRWRLSWNPLEVYRPASSAVGMFQMTDAAFAESRDFCIRDGAVAREGCWFTSLYTRTIPSHAVELTAVYLTRHAAILLGGRSPAKPTARQRQDLAAFIHLCGPGAARAFVRRGLRTAPGERCGDHDVAGYLARVEAFRRQFQRLAAGA